MASGKFQGGMTTATPRPKCSRALVSPGTSDLINAYVRQQITQAGGRVDGLYVCPHRPEAGCACRKPAPGLLSRAAREHGIDLPSSWLIGDILHDVEAGNRAGCRTILLDVGNETEWELAPARIPDLVAGNLLDAARLVINTEARSR